jgi:transcriptional regulator GlxA family with amidase domain
VLFLKRSGGQSQFSTQLQAQFSSVPAIQRVQLWCLENLAGDLHVDALAGRAGMSERSFVRKFLEDTGQPPGEFVMSARLQAACRLLEETRMTPKAVAQRCGLGSPATMRRAFMQRIGVSPRALPRQVRRTGELQAKRPSGNKRSDRVGWSVIAK